MKQFDELREKETQEIARFINSYEAAQEAMGKDAYKDAAEILMSAITPVDPEKQYNWGVVYYNGLGVPFDFESAYYWFTKAYQQGNRDAARALGSMYYLGQYVSQDYQTAFQFFQKAASQGDIQSKRVIGGMYYSGLGVPVDYAAALVFFKEAAEMGDVYAQKATGMMLIDGEGTKVDLVEGYNWIERAAQNGDDECIALLESREKR